MNENEREREKKFIYIILLFLNSFKYIKFNLNKQPAWNFHLKNYLSLCFKKEEKLLWMNSSEVKLSCCCCCCSCWTSYIIKFIINKEEKILA
jgi:hypothetical protein